MSTTIIVSSDAILLGAKKLSNMSDVDLSVDNAVDKSFFYYEDGIWTYKRDIDLIASNSDLGLVKAGDGITIDVDGTINITGGSGDTIPEPDDDGLQYARVRTVGESEGIWEKIPDANWTNMFELVDDGGGVQHIRAKFDLVGDGEITAYGTSAGVNPIINLATSTSIGGIYANNATEGFRGHIVIDSAGFLSVGDLNTTDLDDMPGSLVSKAGYVLTVNSSGTGYELTTKTEIPSTTTDDIEEGDNNLYYTDTRVAANLTVQENTEHRHSHDNKTLLDSIIDSGDGTKFLANNGLYLNGLEAGFGDMYKSTYDPNNIQDDVFDYTNFINTPTIPTNTDQISEASNLYFTQARVSVNSDVIANTSARHTHSNKSILDSITNAGSGIIISATERDKLDGIQEGAQVNTVLSVNGQTGNVIINVSGSLTDLDDVSLSNPTNTQILTYNGTNWVNSNQYVYDDSDVLKDSDANQAVSDTNKVATMADISAAGGGDMLKSVYDTNNNGKVDSAENSDTVSGHTVLTNVPVNAVFTDTVYDDSAIITELGNKQNKSEKGIINGYASLDASGKVPITQLPELGSSSAADITVADVNDNYVGNNVEDVLNEIGTERRVSGFDLEKPETQPDLSWDDATRTFTVSVKSGSPDFHFWVKNKKVIKTASESIQIPDVTQYGYVIYDNDGLLLYRSYANAQQADFYEHAIVGMVYWNAVMQQGLPGSELHGKVMSPATHWEIHETLGAQYVSGLDITGLTDSSNIYTNITSGVFRDEDIRHNVSLLTNTRTLYKFGTDGEWHWTTATNELGYKPSGNTYYVYNKYNTSTNEWELAEGDSTTDFYVVFFVEFPTVDGGGETFKVLSQNAYASRGDARDAIYSERDRLSLDGLISPEYLFLYAIITKRNGNLVTMDDGSLMLDLRKTRGSGGESATAALALNVATDTTSFNNNLSSDDTTVQEALETIDDLFPKQAKPTVPDNLSPSPTVEEIQAILDYAKSIDEKLQTIGLFI